MIPLQDDMNMGDPEEHILWALVNIGGDLDAPLLMPPVVLRRWARHLWECGFRHHPELQMRFYQPPPDGASVLAGGAGRWVAAEAPGKRPQPPPDEAARGFVDALSPSQRAMLRAELDRKEDRDGGDPR